MAALGFSIGILFTLFVGIVFFFIKKDKELIEQQWQQVFEETNRNRGHLQEYYDNCYLGEYSLWKGRIEINRKINEEHFQKYGWIRYYFVPPFMAMYNIADENSARYKGTNRLELLEQDYQEQQANKPK